jgi:hypothetical protein
MTCTQEKSILCRIKFPNQSAYDVMSAIATLKGFETLDDFINYWVRDILDGYAEGRFGFEFNWGYRTKGEEEEHQAELRRMIANRESSIK